MKLLKKVVSFFTMISLMATTCLAAEITTEIPPPGCIDPETFVENTFTPLEIALLVIKLIAFVLGLLLIIVALFKILINHFRKNKLQKMENGGNVKVQDKLDLQDIIKASKTTSKILLITGIVLEVIYIVINYFPLFFSKLF